MSSATSIKRGVRLEAERSVRPKQERDLQVKPDAAVEDSGFRPWHFFVLASLMAATAAVIMSRQARPEHLVLISATIAAAGLAAAGFYRMLAPLASDDVSALSEPLSARARAALEREKALVLRSIKELEFDRAMGKVSARDFDEMVGRLRTRAISLIKELDEGETGYRVLIERELSARLADRTRGDRAAALAAAAADAAVPPEAAAPTGSDSRDCEACHTQNDSDAVFCKRCGGRL
ncbi:MAG TPA: zinc ribbon domain-containing protein [Vicinamibacterales bacterium]|nr:zinc ribbon domain-containing protein [Vicinamibacterales bacterium]